MPHTPPRPPLLRRRRHDLLALALVLLVALLPRIVELGADPPARVLGAFLSDEGWWAQNARQRVLFGEWVMDEHNPALFAAPAYTAALTLTYQLAGLGLAQTRLLSALTPQLLWAASEARVYALAILSVTASTWLFLRLLDPDRPMRDRDLLAYAAVSYLGLLTFYYTGFVLLGHAIAALRSSRAREMTVALGAVGLLFLPWIPGVLDQLQARLNYLPPLDWTTLPPGLALARAAGGWSLATVVESIFRFTPFMRTPAGLALVLASVAGVLAARLRRGSRRLGGTEGQMLLAAATPVAVLLLLRVTNLSLVEERHWVVAVPGLLLLPGLVLAGAAPGWPRRAASALLLATFALGTVSYARNYRGQADWKAVGRYLNRNIHAADPVLFFATDGALPLAYYVPRSNPVYTLPVPNWKRPRAQLEMRPWSSGRSGRRGGKSRSSSRAARCRAG